MTLEEEQRAVAMLREAGLDEAANMVQYWEHWIEEIKHHALLGGAVVVLKTVKALYKNKWRYGL